MIAQYLFIRNIDLRFKRVFSLFLVLVLRGRTRGTIIFFSIFSECFRQYFFQRCLLCFPAFIFFTVQISDGKYHVQKSARAFLQLSTSNEPIISDWPLSPVRPPRGKNRFRETEILAARERKPYLVVRNATTSSSHVRNSVCVLLNQVVSFSALFFSRTLQFVIAVYTLIRVRLQWYWYSL